MLAKHSPRCLADLACACLLQSAGSLSTPAATLGLQGQQLVKLREAHPLAMPAPSPVHSVEIHHCWRLSSLLSLLRVSVRIAVSSEGSQMPQLIFVLSCVAVMPLCRNSDVPKIRMCNQNPIKL